MYNYSFGDAFGVGGMGTEGGHTSPHPPKIQKLSLYLPANTTAMMYLDPKADLPFIEVFGQHKDLTISLINALLPLPADGQVTSIEYLTTKNIPDTPLIRYCVVAVQCQDAHGRQFIVEIQIIWTEAFTTRVLFNSSKAYVRQLKPSEPYKYLQPVYSLSLVNAVFLPDLPDEFIHNYNVVHELHTDKIIDGLHLTFVELPKFKPQSIAERKMTVLWLKFLTEITADTKEAPQELLDNHLTSFALSEVRESAFTPEQMESYDKFWDNIRCEATLIDSAKSAQEKGMAEGLAQGRAEGLAEGEAKGRTAEKITNAKNFLACGVDPETVAQCTGLPLDEVLKLLPK